MNKLLVHLIHKRNELNEICSLMLSVNSDKTGRQNEIKKMLPAQK